MNQPSEFFHQKAQKSFTSTSEFHFPGMDKVLESANENKLEPLIEACYELVPKDQMAPKLKFIFKNGNRCTFPYAYFLRTEFDASGILYLFTSEKEIIIEGRGLDYIEEMLYENQVKWIRESNLSLDPKLDRVFVKGIEVRERQKY